MSSGQNVYESANAPAVRDSIADLVERSQVREVRINADGSRETVGVVSLSQKALETLGELLGATKHLVHGREVTEVPDNHLRLAAAVRILEFSQPPTLRAEFTEEHAESVTRRQVKASL